jgi:hypothetical protein
MLEFLGYVVFEGLLTLFSEVFNLGLRKSLRAPDHTDPLGDNLVGSAVGFILGMASMLVFPVLALSEFWPRLLNAVVSPLIAALLIGWWRGRATLKHATAANTSRRPVLFTVFVVGLAFNLSRLIFGR